MIAKALGFDDNLEIESLRSYASGKKRRSQKSHSIVVELITVLRSSLSRSEQVNDFMQQEHKYSNFDLMICRVSLKG